MTAKLYVGTKVVRAEPMDRKAYNAYRGWDVPADENGDDAGYLVEYMNGGKPNMPDREGYVSWSPKDVFEHAYKADGGLSFGDALDALKKGFKATRADWGDYYLFCSKGGLAHGRTPSDTELNGVPDHLFDRTHSGAITRLPVINGVDTEGVLMAGWTPTQADMLAEDWGVEV